MFKKYDIRGKYPDEVNEKVFARIGRAINKYMDKHNIKQFVIANDYRVHSNTLASALASTSNGVLVGPMPTPCIAHYNGFVGMVTASHNPPEYNGLKLFMNGVAFDFEQYLEIKQIYDSFKIDYIWETINVNDDLRSAIMTDYVNSLPHITSKGSNIIFDLGGGAVCAIRDVFSNRIFDVPDPLFTKRKPEPKNETLNRLKEVAKGRIGVAFDGDADRIVAIDKELIWPDVLGAFFLEKGLINSKNVVMTIDSSSKIYDRLFNLGYNLIYSPVGGGNVINKMKEFNDSYGFENSGHYYLSDRNYVSDGPYFALLLSQVNPGDIFNYQQSLGVDRIMFTVPYYVKIADAKDMLEEMGATKFVMIDGVKGISNDWSVLIRNSNTETKARINIEGKGINGIEKIIRGKIQDVSLSTT